MKTLYQLASRLFLGVLLFAASAAHAQFTYTTNNGTIAITGYTGSGGAVTIPNVIDGLPVTEITSNVFLGDGINSVSIPDTVTSIGAGAFQGCYTLTAINVAPGNPAYSSVGGVLFNQSHTTLLAYPVGLGGSFTIPATVLTIGATAFQYCSVTNVTLSLGLVDIESNAFTGCPLNSVTIPDTVTNIGDYAFYDCLNLTNITIGSNVVSIGSYAFSGLVQVTSDGEEPGSVSFGCPLASVTIPNSVTSIGANAFCSCTLLTNVMLGNGVTSIGDYAFYGCGLLTNVTLGKRVTNIGQYAFSGDPLTAINVVPGNPAYSSVAGVLFNQGQTTLIEFPPSYSAAAYSIPDGVTSIGNGAFADTDLTSVTIPSSVTNIGIRALEGCANLTAINVAAGNPAYGSVAGVLFNQSDTTLLAYPVGLGGSYAIPATVLTIGATAFQYCSVTNVTLSLGLVDIESNAFTGCPLNSVTIPDTVTNIGDHAFYGCISLTNIVLDNSLISIGAYAFSGPLKIPDFGSPFVLAACPLTSITVPASVTTIGDYAFQGCPLRPAYFLGNAPDADATVFLSGPLPPRIGLTAYYLPGTTGWAEFTTNTGVPTALWTLPYPLVLNSSSGVLNNQFGFTISWATNVPVVVEASADLSDPIWTPIATKTLTGGTSYFSDPDWTNYPNRFYRIRSQ